MSLSLPSAVVAGIIPGGMELVVILFIVVLLFGATKLPQLAKGLGQSIKEFKKASKDVEEAAEPAAERSPAELKAELAAAKAELALAKGGKREEHAKSHGHN